MYADANNYTYTPTAERLLVQSNNWPADVNRQLLEQQVENIRLQEANAWLEAECAALRGELDRLIVRVNAQGRKLASLVRMVEGG